LTVPVLASPRDGGNYELDCDACDSGIGAVLQQWQDGLLRVIAYASRTLTPAEKGYCTTRKEQLAMVYGLKQFRPYILGHGTAVRSDHSALMYLKRAKEPVGQQARWMDFILLNSLLWIYSTARERHTIMPTRCRAGRARSEERRADNVQVA